MSKLKENLLAARKLIEVPENWACCVQEVGVPNKYCALSAIGAAVDITAEQEECADALTRAVGGHVPRFNDTHTHAEVLAAYDKAISAAVPA